MLLLQFTVWITFPIVLGTAVTMTGIVLRNKQGINSMVIGLVLAHVVLGKTDSIQHR